MASPPDPLDALVDDILARCGLHFSLAVDAADRAAAYRLRAEAVLAQGWAAPADLPGGLERDAYDERALHLLGRDDDGSIVATGRIVPPPGPLPTEVVCGIVVPPRGRVADVGRMVVARSHRSHRNGAFLALLARLYREVQSQGCVAGCGLVSAPAQALMRLLGLPLERLGDERPYWGEPRAPVRFAVGGQRACPAPVADDAPRERRPPAAPHGRD
jgi:N-acyl-L-homoserine lactone synthetase